MNRWFELPGRQGILLPLILQPLLLKLCAALRRKRGEGANGTSEPLSPLAWERGRTEGSGVRGWLRAPTAFSLRSWRPGGLFVLFLLCFTMPAFAQGALDDGVVSADEVNMVARRLYCPVCPNERLDACQTQACVNWRSDIRVQLEAGRNEDEIVADFVRRYGERAAGVPIDPTLNALSLVTPYVIAVIALAVGVFTFLRWRKRPTTQPTVLTTTSAASPPDQDYRSALEKDVEG